MRIVFFGMGLVMLLISCGKSDWGEAVITGKVYINVYDQVNSTLLRSHYAQEEDVYIVHGNDAVYTTRFRTHYDGTFRFDGLAKGTYTIYTYSADTLVNSVSGKVPVARQVTVGSNSQVVTIDDLVIIKRGRYNDGSSVISGNVVANVYNSSFKNLLNTYNAWDEDVYLYIGDNTTYIERIRTNDDGSFSFTNLNQGRYRVAVYSVDTTIANANANYSVVAEVDIDGDGQRMSTGTISIVKKGRYTDGTSVIRGRLYAHDYNADFSALLQSYYMPDERVYIVFGDEQFHFDDVRTHHDGTFEFRNLVKGDYTVYALSRDFVDKNSRKLVPVKQVTIITENNQEKNIGNIVIYN